MQIVLKKPVQFTRTNGFERYDFVHNALPEVNVEEIDLSQKFLGRTFKLPFFIESMTGGFPGIENVNRNLALAAEKLGIGMGVGSQRVAVENPEVAYTFQIREQAPTAFLIGNFGGAQLLKYPLEYVKKAKEMIQADGMAIHLNPAQEIVQPEGDRNWKGIEEKIRQVCASGGFPVIAKEVGNGISGAVAKRLERAGVAAIDVAGAGGTSWVKVEHYRGAAAAGPFFEWGIPTAECVVQCAAAVQIPLIASGGMRTGMDAAKALALGATLVGFASPLLKPATESADAVVRHMEGLMQELKTIMFLVGARTIADLRKATIVRRF